MAKVVRTEVYEMYGTTPYSGWAKRIEEREPVVNDGRYDLPCHRPKERDEEEPLTRAANDV